MKNKTKIALSALATTSIIASTAQAAVPPEVTTALSDSAIDIAAVGGAVMAVVVVIFAFRAMRKAL